MIRSVTLRGRVATWWRLLLAVGVIVAPLAVSGAAAAATTPGPLATLHARAHLDRAPAVAVAKPPSPSQHALQRLPGQMSTGVAAGLVTLVWFAVAAATRRSGHLLWRAGSSRRTRAPPAWTAADVPFGPALGRAGRFARSRCAPILNPGSIACR